MTGRPVLAPALMIPGSVVVILQADGRRWPDHTDAWRFGPMQCPLTVPPTLPVVAAVRAALHPAAEVGARAWPKFGEDWR